MAVPSTGADAVVDDHASNVWASGAATAAFDAFDDHVPAVAVSTTCTRWRPTRHRTRRLGVHAGLDALDDAGVPDVAGVDDPSLQFDGPVIDDAPVVDAHETRPRTTGAMSVPEDHHLERRRLRLRHLRLVSTQQFTKRGPRRPRLSCAFTCGNEADFRPWTAPYHPLTTP